MGKNKIKNPVKDFIKIIEHGLSDQESELLHLKIKLRDCCFEIKPGLKDEKKETKEAIDKQIDDLFITLFEKEIEELKTKEALYGYICSSIELIDPVCFDSSFDLSEEEYTHILEFLFKHSPFRSMRYNNINGKE